MEHDHAILSMVNGDVDMKAEMPEPTRRVSDGIAEGKGLVHQITAAGTGTRDHKGSELMEEVLRRENLNQAFKRVTRNKGSAGVDGLKTAELQSYLWTHWGRIRDELVTGTYEPLPVRRVEIPKPGSRKKRQLGIPAVMDRLIQQAILQVLQPLIDPLFSDSSYGFRPKRSAQQAVKKMQSHIASGKRWVVDLDLEKFFDLVNHDILMSIVARHITDKSILKLIRKYLTAGILIDGVVSPNKEGTPQGGPLSPFLSNILLDVFDKELESRGHCFVRYADDLNIYVRSKRAGQRVLATVEHFLNEKLKLKINRDKSAVDRPWKRSFLGYSVTFHKIPRLKVAAATIKRLKSTYREIFHEGRGKRLSTTLAILVPKIRGWTSYYKLAEVKGVFEDLDQWLRRHCRLILWRQWKKPRTRARKLIALGLSKARAHRSAYNGYGPWRNSYASHMNAAISNKWLNDQGLLSFLQMHRYFAWSV